MDPRADHGPASVRPPLAPSTGPASPRGGRDAALRTAIQTLATAGVLSDAAVTDAFGVIMDGLATPAQIGALLLGLRARGETAGELAGVVRAVRRTMIPLAARHPEELVDTCGTGGGTVPTFNISTVAAFVARGAGVRVAKHGNRSFTSRCGSADVLEALGLPLEVPVPVLVRVLEEAGMVFMFAPVFHPAMRHVGPVRRELGVQTVMNLVGPLANPAGASRQVVGVSDPQRLQLVADALRALGARHAMVVHGEPGLDEISPLGSTRVIEVRNDGVRSWTIEPREYDLHTDAAEDLRCGDPLTNARLTRELLAGRAPRGARAAVVLNAAAAIYVGGRASSFAEAVGLAGDALDGGAGLEALRRMQVAYTAAATRPDPPG